MGLLALKGWQFLSLGERVQLSAVGVSLPRAALVSQDTNSLVLKAALLIAGRGPSTAVYKGLQENVFQVPLSVGTRVQHTHKNTLAMHLLPKCCSSTAGVAFTVLWDLSLTPSVLLLLLLCCFAAVLSFLWAVLP
jgi:hypothetical protein